MNSRVAQAVAAAALAALATTAAMAAAADKPDPSLQVRNPKLKVTWDGPDTRVPPFDRVLLEPIGLQFRDVPPLSGPPGAPTTRTEFPVTERDRQRLAETFEKVFREQLGDNSHFKLVTEPGAGVLVVKASVRDIVSRMPPEEPPGRSSVYIDTVGDATLVVEFVDPATDRTLGKASDRRTAQPAASTGNFGAVRANRVGAGFEVNRLARKWAASLEKRLDQLYFEAKPR